MLQAGAVGRRDHEGWHVSVLKACVFLDDSSKAWKNWPSAQNFLGGLQCVAFLNTSSQKLQKISKIWTCAAATLECAGDIVAGAQSKRQDDRVSMAAKVELAVAAPSGLFPNCQGTAAEFAVIKPDRARVLDFGESIVSDV